MREILFRGKRVDNGEWVYGSYAFAPKRKGAFGQIISDLDQERHYIVSKTNYEYWEVCPETVGQYTGLNDKNGKKIFEGDIIECDVFGAMVTVEHRKYLVAFENGTYVGQWSIGKHKFSTYMHETWGRNVVGNKWDNSELLEVMR